jgi:Ran GTPase-activating protein (RanGAP) involved in mRNA processing and transport
MPRKTSGEFELALPIRRVDSALKKTSHARTLRLFDRAIGIETGARIREMAMHVSPLSHLLPHNEKRG